MSGNILDVSCPSFTYGQIPIKHTGFGEDISPEIVIGGLCDKAKTLAIVMDDLDVPFIGELNHWVIWNLPPDTVISENIPYGAICENGAVQGIGYGKNRYRGPKQPPFVRKVHRYRFQVYALDCVLDLPESSRKKDLLMAMSGHILQSGEVVGTYRRK